MSSRRHQLRSHQRLRRGPHQPGQPARHPQLVVRRGQEARDDQLPHLPPGKGRPVLRAHLRPGKGLGMRLRQVPRHEVQGHDLRPLRRQGHAQPRPPQAHGPHRAGRPGRPHLVLQGHAQPPRHAAGHEDHQPGKDHLLPGLRRHRPGRHAAQEAPAADRGRLPQGPRELRRRLRGRHGRRGRQEAARGARPRRPVAATCARSCETESHKDKPSKQKLRDLVKRLKMVESLRDSRPGRPAEQAEWMVLECIPVIPPDLRPLVLLDSRQLRHQRPERSLSPHHQPQQPPQEAGRPQRPRGHHPQREADAAAVGRRAVRQQPLQAAGARLAATARSSR